MSKRIYPVTVENGELVESNEKLTVNGLPIAKDGTIDSSYVSGSSSEWTVDANGNLVPKDGEPVQVGSLRSDEVSITNLGARAYLSANQSLSTGSLTKIQIDTANYDDEGEFDSANYQISIADSGRYNVVGRVTFHSALTDGTQIYVQIQVNGSKRSESQIPIGAGTYASIEVTDVLDLSAGDSVELYAMQKSGGAVDALGGSRYTALAVSQEG